MGLCQLSTVSSTSTTQADRSRERSSTGGSNSLRTDGPGCYVNGRGRISRRFPDRHRHGGVEFWKDFGREVAEECLETLRCTQGLRVGAVYRHGPPEEFARTRQHTYGA
jgi:hypothetical protein